MLDGKAIKSTDAIKTIETMMNIVTAYTDTGISLGQITVDNKSNEIPAVRELIEMLKEEENKLWYQYLAKSNKRFLRQKIVDNYILDFYCPEKKLGIEIDGSQHYTEKGIQYDKIRTNILKEYKIKIIRFTNQEMRQNFTEVCEYIENIINTTDNKKQI